MHARRTCEFVARGLSCMNYHNYFSDKSDIISNQYKNLYETTLCILKGNLGCGKSEIIKHFLSNVTDYTIVRYDYKEMDAFCSIKTNWTITTNCTPLLNEKNDKTNMTYRECIIYDFIASCKSHPDGVVIFDDLAQYTQKESLTTVVDIIKLLVNCYKKLKLFIIVEYSEDMLQEDIKNIIYDLQSFINHDNVIKIPKLNDVNCIYYFKSLFNEPTCISDSMILRICHSAFCNFTKIKRLIEYLKDVDILYFQNGFWQCRDVDTNIIYNFFKNHIKLRYDKLEFALQDVLKKASITGIHINTSLMKKPLRVIDPETKLNSIKIISELVECECDNYIFETLEVHNHVQNDISEEKQLELHLTIAEYLRKLLKNASHNDLFTLREQKYNIAIHYYAGHNYEEALAYFVQCIALSYSIKDYVAMKQSSNYALTIDSVIDIDDYHYQFIIYSMAVACENLSEFPKASENFKTLLDSMANCVGLYDVYKIRYHYGYCLRRAGYTEKAFYELEELKNILKSVINNDLTEQKENFQRLLVDTLIVLIGIVDQVGKKDLKERYFNWCLTISQNFVNKELYYRLLTKSSMYYKSQISNKMMNEAFLFFDNSNNRYDAAKASYNLGMNEIYRMELDLARNHITYAYEIFSTYDSKNISYPSCALGILETVNANYDSAIKYFESVLHFATNDFAKITAFINISHCYRMLGDFDGAKINLKIAHEIFVTHPNDKLVLKRNIYFAKAMIEYEDKNILQAIEYVKTAFYVERDDLKYTNYTIYLAKCITEFSVGEGIEVPEDIKALSLEKLSPYKQHCFDKKVLWGNFMFW